MFIKKSKLISVILSIMLMFTLLPFLPKSTAYAAGQLRLSKDEITFDDYGFEWQKNRIETTVGSVAITGAESNDESIAKIERYGASYVEVAPVDAGTTFITIHGKGVSDKKVTITVTTGWEEDNLKENVRLYNNWYGSRKLEVFTFLKGSCSIKISSKKYTLKFTGNEDYSQIIKLKKLYALKTKIYLTFKAPSGTTFKKTYKMVANTSLVELNGSGKKIKATIYNSHKGDVVKIKYKGKYYSKKIKKDYDSKSYVVTFKVKKTVTKSASIKVEIKNSKKKTLLKGAYYTLRDGYWSEDMDDYDDSDFD